MENGKIIKLTCYNGLEIHILLKNYEYFSELLSLSNFFSRKQINCNS